MRLEEIKEMVVGELSANMDELTEETKFVDDLGADSLDLFSLAMAMEEKYGIDIPSEDLTKIVTIGDAVNYIDSRLA